MRLIKNNLTVLTMVFISGFAVMSVEMLGGRILAPYFGSSVYVWGSLIFTFMVGLSIGYGVGGKLSLRLYGPGVLSFFLAMAGAQILLLELLAEPILEFTFNRTNDPRSGSLIAAMVLYLIPTATLGTISPLAIRTISDHLNEVGNYAGTLYLVSTFGSAVGTLVTAFWLVAFFEVDTIVYFNVAGLLLAAGMGFRASRRERSKI